MYAKFALLFIFLRNKTEIMPEKTLDKMLRLLHIHQNIYNLAIWKYVENN